MTPEDLKRTLADKTAVLDGIPEHPAVKALSTWDGAAFIDAKLDRGEVTLTVAAEKILDALRAVRAAGYKFFEDLTAVDWHPLVPRFQISYHILSHAHKERIRLRVMLNEEDAAIESITSLWAGANYYEREVFDLFGIRFEGHPNLRRIMMPDEWKGHPLRKDYPVEGYR